MLTKIADIIDFLHIFIVIGIVLIYFSYLFIKILGKKCPAWLNKLMDIFGIFVLFILILQILSFDCPMTLCADYLRQCENPNYEFRQDGFLLYLLDKVFGIKPIPKLFTIISLLVLSFFISILIYKKRKKLN